MRLLKSLIALSLGAAFAASTSGIAAAEPVKVVASFSILGDMVREIGGDDVALTTLVGPDGDAHVYEPTPSDARALGQAKLLVVNGLHFEGWLPRLVETSGFKGTEVVATTGVTPIPFAGQEEEADGASAGKADTANAGHAHAVDDPHAFQDLSNGVIYARNIVKGLSEVDPAHAADYGKRAETYIAELKAMDARVRDVLAAIPAERRRVVTSHDAFGYFARAYGIDFIAPEGVSTETEASASDVARIIDQIRAEKITAVFVENITDTRLIERIATETKARIGGTLYSDALSAAGGPAATYIEMFANNIEQIAKALKTS